MLIIGRERHREGVARPVHSSHQRAAKLSLRGGQLRGLSRRRLLESELFGHVRGAFTGAVTSRPGKFELASGGPSFWTKSARCRPAFSPNCCESFRNAKWTGWAIRGRCAWMCASSPRQTATSTRWSEEGSFRADLFYRLDVVPLTLPPLRERREDIPDLVEHFVAQARAAGARRAPFGRTAPAPDGIRLAGKCAGTGKCRSPDSGAFQRSGGGSRGPGGKGSGGQEKRRPPDSPPKGLRCATWKSSCSRGRSRPRAETELAPRKFLGVSLRTVRNKIREFGLPPRRFS